MMKLLFFIAMVMCVRAQDVTHSFTCISGDETTTATDCKTAEAVDDTAAKALAFCHKPKNSVADNTYTDYGCGDCPADQTDNCESCPAWDSADTSDCNVYEAPLISFQCMVNKVATDCTAAAAIACFGPAKTYKGNEVSLTNGGCGTCAAAKATATDATWEVADCLDCDTKNCNSSAYSMVSFLAPLIALLWIVRA